MKTGEIVRTIEFPKKPQKPVKVNRDVWRVPVKTPVRKKEEVKV